MTSTRWVLPEERTGDVRSHLFARRSIAAIDQDAFLSPSVPQWQDVASEVGIPIEYLRNAVTLVEAAIAGERPIIIFGDYDVDGVAATALMWESLYYGRGYSHVYPYIPDRVSEGYGLSQEALCTLNQRYPEALLITVDCGITGAEEVSFAHSLGMQVILTDHHHVTAVIPFPDVLLHSTKLTGAGVAWLLGAALHEDHPQEVAQWDLVALGALADVYPLTGTIRSFVVHGLAQMQNTPRLGIRALLRSAGMDPPFTAGQVSWQIIPRLNAAGRMASALDALRLLCTRSEERAEALAAELTRINEDRQRETEESVFQARLQVNSVAAGIVVTGKWHEGVVGLIAGRLKEEFHRPVLAISEREGEWKGSGRSIPALNLIETLRERSELFTKLGGHPLAAGFALPEENVSPCVQWFSARCSELLQPPDFEHTLYLDITLTLEEVTPQLYSVIQSFAPFGPANPEPLCFFSQVGCRDVLVVGRDGAHLRFRFDGGIEGIGFRLGERIAEIPSDGCIDLVGKIKESTYNGRTSLQIEVVDFRRAQ